MTDKIKIEDLTSFSMLDHLTDLDSIVNYWSILDEEPEGYQKEAGMDIFSRAAYRFVKGGNGNDTLLIPSTMNHPSKVRQWLKVQKFDYIDKQRVGSVGNVYGSLEVFECDLKHYWTIGDPAYGPSYQEIPKSLYDELLKFEATYDRQT